MLKRTCHILVCFAAIIITLHNVTPHYHQELSGDTMAISEQSNWDFLAEIFNFDMGDGHLEYFSEYQADFSQNISISVLPNIIPLIPWLDLSEKNDEDLSSKTFFYLVDYQDDRFSLCQVDRGPPMMV